MMTEAVFAQALLLTGELELRQMELLRLLCGSAVSSLTLRLRDGLTAEDCGGDFIAAASLYALAALESAEAAGGVEEFRAGDLTVKQGASGDAAAKSLEKQAERIIAPYVKDRFAFLEV